ncbi:MAG: hypothetical protein ACKO2H_07190, partial [Bacteroidota bacterium]
MQQDCLADPFAISFNGLSTLPFPSFISMVENGIESVLGLSAMTDKYHEALHQSHSGESFYDTVLKVMDCQYEVQGIEHIPTEGRTIIVANHPLGGVEGVILGSMLGK